MKKAVEKQIKTVCQERQINSQTAITRRVMGNHRIPFAAAKPAQ
jgi:hypothetical protein